MIVGFIPTWLVLALCVIALGGAWVGMLDDVGASDGREMAAEVGTLACFVCSALLVANLIVALA